MKVFTISGFTGHWPVGTAAVVCAENAEQAARELNTALEAEGLPGDCVAGDMDELAQDHVEVRILADGNY